MNSIPVAIENALIEAGFTPTEVLVLRRLLEDDALTLRELASRTGKSTGVLDQALKKLMRKNILRKDAINESGKYTINSWEFVLEWLQQDMKEKRELINRQQQNFESFIKNVQQDKKRPDVQYYEGIEGLAQAYRKLLDCGSEIIGYVPVFCSIEDHPLSEFMVEWFRSRRTKDVFLRAITHDTPLGRRYHSRDPFEYRQSLLVDEEAYPFTFEKLVCGDLIVCFNYTEKRACMLRYPELASMERSLFEGVWKYLQQKDRDEKEAITPADLDPLGKKATPPPTHPSVPLQVKTLSRLREFFLSRKSVVTFFIFAVIAAAVTFGISKKMAYLNLQRIREQVISIAATGALQFDARDLNQLHSENDLHKPEYSKVIAQLNEIRSSNSNIKYAYIMRPTAKENIFTFVADADSLHPFEEKDVNKDGVIDDVDHLSPPGEPYDISPYGRDLRQQLIEARERPVADTAPFVDSWGAVFGAVAPIKDESGKTVAMLWIDRAANDLTALNNRTLVPIYCFIVFFLLFFFIRFAAFNQSFLEIFHLFSRRKRFLL